MNMKDSLQFRPRKSNDDDFIRKLTLSEMSEVFAQSIGAPLPEELIDHLLQHHVFIICQGDKRIGYTSYVILSPEEIYWSALVVIPGLQGKRVGTRVAQMFEEFCLAKGVSVLHGHVQSANIKAIQFWIKQGWQIVHPSVMGNLSIRKRIG